MKIQSSGFYLLRTPALPISKIIDFNNTNPSNEEAALFFAGLLNDKTFLEAIYIASPDFYDQVMGWDRQSVNQKEPEKILLSLYKYFIRMCSRCTPYGLFAGCSMGTITETTRIELEGLEKSHRNIRLDMNYVGEIVDYLLNIDPVKENSLFYPNSSLYKIADKYRYLEYRIINKQRMYYLTQVSANTYLEKLLTLATKGGTIANMIAVLCAEDEVNEEEANEFVEQLIQSQILISEFELMITGEEFFDQLLDKLKSFPGADMWLRPFLMVNKILKSENPSIADYLQISRLLKGVLPDTNAKDLIQVDLFTKSAQNELSDSFVNDLAKSFEKLYKINFLAESMDLSDFRNAFLERYEAREMPLMDVLDPETGIGYGKMVLNNTDFTPLIDDINFTSQTEEKLKWTRLRNFQLKKIVEASGKQLKEVLISDADLAELSETTTNVPDSLYIHGLVSATQSDKFPLDFVLISNVGPSGASLLGRFCHGDKGLSENVCNYLHDEELHNAECIYAEIVHLPQSRVGNILMRPFLREYEIVYLGNSVLKSDNQIRVEDLMISVRNGEVILRSKRLKKRIIPRMTTAHAFANGNLSTYKFLCDLQFQNMMPGVNWNWGPFASLAYLPEVRYKNIILSRRTWNLNKKNFDTSKNASKADIVEQLYEVVAELGLPKHVLLVEGDNELLLDTECRLSLKILAENISKRNVTTIVEFLNSPEKCIVEGNGGRYIGEFIIPLKKELPKEKANKLFYQLTNETAAGRIFIPGSEWLYLKIYCGTSTSEKILTEILKPLSHSLLEEDIIDKWFFIRYYDPKPHIRVRFHNGKDPSFTAKIQQRLYPVLNDYVNSNLVFNYQIDTYTREIERYSAGAMALSEDLFFYDSMTVVNFIDLIEGYEGETLRWLFAIRGVDVLLDDFKCTIEFKAEILSDLQNNFFNEFGASPQLKRLLDNKYRSSMKEISEVLDENLLKHDAFAETEQLSDLFVQRSRNLAPVVDEIMSLTGDNSFYLKDLIFSYIHMFINRMFISNQRKHEMVIYHYLKKYYTSRIAQNKNKMTVKGGKTIV
ncbi:MAG: lantibiotic dehydratase [Chitinophagaceae bacterium]